MENGEYLDNYEYKDTIHKVVYKIVKNRNK